MGNIGWYRDKLPTRDQYRYKTAQPCTTYNWIGSLRLQFVRSVFYFQLGIPQTAVLLTRDEYSLLHLPIFCSSNCSINPYHPQKIAVLYISIPIYPFPQVFIGFHILPPQSFLGFCRVVRGCSFSLFLRKNCDTEPFPIFWPFLLLKGVPWSRHAIILHLCCRANHWMPRQKTSIQHFQVVCLVHFVVERFPKACPPKKRKNIQKRPKTNHQWHFSVSDLI